jgi:hypothetical protein
MGRCADSQNAISEGSNTGQFTAKATIQAGGLSFVNKRFTAFTKIRNFTSFRGPGLVIQGKFRHGRAVLMRFAKILWPSYARIVIAPISEPAGNLSGAIIPNHNSKFRST